MKTSDKFRDKLMLWSNDALESMSKRNMKLKNSFDYNNKTLIFNVSIINRKTAWTRGSSNKTEDNYFIPYFDYDRMKESYVVEELKILQEQFDLGDILLFQSSENNFQAVGFAKLTLHQFQEVLMHSSCDYAFIKFPKYLPYAKYYVLRQFSKGKISRPQYLYTIKRKTNKQQSFAHWKYFNILYPDAKINKLTNSDNLGKMVRVEYPTGSNV